MSSGFGAGTHVDQFKILRQVGKGGMATVYLARDSSLGRLVALKMINGNVVDPRALARFLFEARATATFSHPNIVSIYSVGEYHGTPYVALEYLEGDTLRARLERSPPSYREALRIAHAIAEALTEAHKHKLIHRDLKPENILLPKDGRLRVVDFGLAKLFERAPASEGDALETRDLAGVIEGVAPAPVAAAKDSGVAGTPGYMAPEQWMNESGPASDVWALGIILCELLSGKRPYAGMGLWQICREVRSPDPVSVPDLGEIPTELTALVGRCLEKDPTRRPTLDEVRGLLEHLVQAGSLHFTDESPFRGLSSFHERHAGLFFGRDAEIANIVERLRDEPIVPVVGPSGAGKSSFVAAGVIPRLREQGRWAVVTLRPGRAPFDALAAKLAVPESTRPDLRSAHGTYGRIDHVEAPPAVGGAVEPDRELGQRLKDSPALLGVKLAELAQQRQMRVLLVVDAVEELYTLVDDADLRRRFLEAMCGAAVDAQEPVRVVFTIRDDFLGRVSLGESARDVLSRVFVLRAPEPQALHEILTRPVGARGYAYDDGLVDEMVAAVAGEATSLPLIQFAGEVLWQGRDKTSKRLLRITYERMGGVTGALARHADGVIEALPPDDVRIARDLFLRMVTAEGTRRSLPRTEVLEGLPDRAVEVLERLTSARLISQRKARGADGAGDTTLELVHESLISRWTQLSRWIESSHEEIAILNDARQAALVWQRRGSKPADLWSGEALRDAQRVLGRGAAQVPDVVARFLAAGQAQEREAQRRRRRLVVGAIAVASLVATGSLGAAILVAKQRRRADAQAARAVKQRAEAQRESAESAFARGEMLEARAKLRASLETDDSPRVQALWWALEHDPRLWRLDLRAGTVKVAYSPDGRRLALGLSDGSILLLDSASLQHERTLRGHTTRVESLRFSSDGSLRSLAAPYDLRQWDLSNGTSQPANPFTSSGSSSLAPTLCGDYVDMGANSAALKQGAREVSSAESGVHAVIGPDRIALSGPALGKPRVLQPRLDHFGEAAFSPDEAVFAYIEVGASGGEELSVYRISDESIRSLPITGPTRGLASSGEGNLVAAADANGVIRVWNVATRQMTVLRGHEGLIRAMAFSPDERLLASDAADETVRIWDLASGQARAVYHGFHFKTELTFKPDGSELVTSEIYQGHVQAWRVPTADAPIVESQLGTTEDRDGISVSMALTRDGDFAVTKTQAGVLRRWNLATGEVTELSREARKAFYAVATSPVADLVAHTDAIGRIHLMGLSAGGEHRTLVGPDTALFRVAFRPDGRELAAGGDDKTVYLWDLRTERIRQRLPHTALIMDIAYDAAGTRLATSEIGGELIRVWDTATGKLLRSLPGKGMGAVTFSPDGASLAVGEEGGVAIRELKTGRRRFLSLGDSVRALAFHSDGVRLAISQSSGGAARIWNTATNESIVLVGHQSTAAVDVIRFTPDGRRVVTASDDGTVRVWDAATGRPVWWAPAMTVSPPQLLSHRGWEPLGPQPGPPNGEQAPMGARYRQAIESRARLAVESEDHQRACAYLYDGTPGGTVELWELVADGKRWSAHAGAASRVLALPEGRGCATLEGGTVRVYEGPDRVRELQTGVTAIETSGSELLVGRGKQVLVLDAAGQTLKMIAVEDQISAVARLDAVTLAVGHVDGSVEIVPLDGPGGSDRKYVRPNTAVSPVLRLLAGPSDTLVIACASGRVAVVDRANGKTLFERLLHGPAVHLGLVDGTLYAASELGDAEKMRLSSLGQPRCSLLRNVWGKVAVTWAEGRVVTREPPAEHPCANGGAP